MPQLVRAALGLGPLARPAGRADEPIVEQPDVEDVGTVHLLLDGEQVQEQRREAAPVESGGDLAVARAQPVGAAAVSEDGFEPCLRQGWRARGGRHRCKAEGRQVNNPDDFDPRRPENQ